MFTYFFTPPTPQNRNNRKKKKNVGILLLVPTSQGLRITHHCKIEQREAHAVLLLMLYQYTLTQTFTAAFSLTMVIKSCEVLRCQRKTSVNVFLYVCHPPIRRNRLTSERQGQKYKNYRMCEYFCERNLGLSGRWDCKAMRDLLRIINPYIQAFRIANPKGQSIAG